MAVSVGIIPVLIVLNFYGLYTNEFYFFKVDNYIFPLLTIVHFSFMQAIHTRIETEDIDSFQLRNLEYAMYAILSVYVFKVMDTSYILMSYQSLESQIIPETFLPMGIAIISLQFLLVILTLFSFMFRRQLVGKYNFDHINDKLDSWQ